MSIKKPRINITCEQETILLLSELAKKQDRSTAGFAKELILKPLEMREDVSLSKLSQIRDLATSTRVTHSNAWK
jgi:predicted DNA-binding protein